MRLSRGYQRARFAYIQILYILKYPHMLKVEFNGTCRSDCPANLLRTNSLRSIHCVIEAVLHTALVCKEV